MESGYLVELIFLLLAAVIAVPICQAIKLGAVPGFLLAGVIVGPSGLALIGNVEHIAHIAEFGVVLLLFLIGMEMKPAFLWKIRRLVFGLGSLQIILTGTAISFICYGIFNLSLAASILIGPALALSSTAFVLQLINEQKALTSEYGRTSVAVLLMQDLAVVPLLALIPLLSDKSGADTNIALALVKSIGVLVLVIGIGRYLLNPILHRVALSKNSEVFTASAVLIVIGTAYLTEHAGLSMAMGAFLAGLLISDSAYRHQIRAEVQPFRGILLGLFFMSMGMSLNLEKFFDNPMLIIALTIGLIVLKVSLLYGLAKSFKLDTSRSLAVALILGQSGEFALVLFSLAEKNQIIGTDNFHVLLLIVLLSMLITPLLAVMANKYNKRSNTVSTEEVIPDGVPVIIAGYGRVGKRIGEMLSMAGVPFVALDQNAANVATYQKQGLPVYYGDVTKPELLHSAGITHAKYMIVTVNEPEVATALVETVHQIHPDIHVYARGHNGDICRELMSLGAYNVVSENIEASIELTRLILNGEGLALEAQNNLLNEYKHNYYHQVNKLPE